MKTLLLLIAIIITAIGFIPLLIIQTLARKKQDEIMADYHYNIAVHFDYLWGALIFGRMVDAKTVSALVFKYQKGWAINFIDFIFELVFKEIDHCRKAFLKEFGKKEA